MISQSDALRILDLPPDTPVAEARAQCRRQLQEFRAALELAADDAERQRLRRAVALLRLAADRLRGRADTQEVPSAHAGLLSLRHRLAIAAIGACMVAVGLWPVAEPEAPDSTAQPLPLQRDVPPAETETPAVAAPPTATVPVPSPAPTPTPTPAPAAADVPDPAALVQALEPMRARLVARWQRQDGSVALPEQTVLAGLPLPDAPADWRWLGQRDGIFALLRDGDRSWLVAAPIIRDGQLAWGCFTSMEQQPGCLALDGAGMATALRAGALDAVGIARALETQLRDSRPAPDYRAEAWYRHAVALGYPQAGRQLAERILAGPDADADARREAYGLLEFAHAGFAERGATTTAAGVASELAYYLAMQDTDTRELAAGWLVRCRDLLQPQGQAEAVCAAPADFAYALEVAALEDGTWAPVRWWYEQAVAEQSAAGAEGLARVLAFGRTGAVERHKALALLQDAAQRWDSFDQARAATAAASLARTWDAGWGVQADIEQAGWWHAQAARLGHVGSALQLASSFVLGVGVPRDTDRARQIVDMFTEYSHLFELAFYRTIGERLESGAGVDADPAAARAWYRRAYEMCRALAEGGDDAARLELAGMYFAGQGAPRNPARAAALYADLTDHDPLRARNMLAWIRATAPERELRDGAQAVELARDVVAEARSAEHLDTLAAALAEQGDYIDAVRTQQQALQLLEARADPLAAGADIAQQRADYRDRLARYETGRPWRDDANS